MSFLRTYERTVKELRGILAEWETFAAADRASFRDEFEWVLLRRKEEPRSLTLLGFDVQLLQFDALVREKLGMDVAHFLTSSTAVQAQPTLYTYVAETDKDPGIELQVA